MKKLNVLYGNNTYLLFKHSLKQIAPFIQDLTKENIVIVPDKLSLDTEQEIFNALNIDVFYNISVMGISKFASKIIAQNQLGSMQCSNQEAKLLTLKAIQNVCEKFECFSKNYTLGFVDEIYAKIEQIKSSNANIDDLVDPNALIGTKLKYNDLKLIYNEYEKLRNGKIDSGELLSLFNQVCLQSDFLKNANVFFVGFDSLTKQSLQVLKNVAQNANYTQISITYAKNQSNQRIYDQTFFESVINLCKQEKIECEPVWCDLSFKNFDKQNILNNLFSRKQVFEKENNFFDIIRANSFYEEIELCVKQINYLLKTKDDLKYSDIAICADVSYFDILVNQLQNLDISVYTDKQIDFETLEPIKFLVAVLQFAQSKNPKHLYNVLTNEFCDLNKEQLQTYLSLLGAYSSPKIINTLQEENICDVKNFVEDLSSLQILHTDSVENYLKIIENIIKKYEIIEKINKKCDFFEKKNQVLLNKTYLQIEKKLLSCLEIIQNTMANTIITFDEFFEIFKKVLQETKINAVPACVNQVFVGDIKSFYLNKKYLFVLGMNEGVMPVVLNDTGLISDKEINSESIKAKLEPTTKIINKRNKFKLFENILSPSEKCFLYYHAFGGDNKQAQANDFVTELLYLFGNKQILSQSLKTLIDDSDIKKLAFNLIDEYNANLMLNNDLNVGCYATIKNALQKNNAVFKMAKVNDKSFDFAKLFFVDNKTSISIIEKYNACPKSAFLANALKLKPVKKDKVEANIIGSFLHEVGEKFVKKNQNNLGKMTAEEIKLNVQTVCESVLENEMYYALKLPTNCFLLGLLKNEAVRFCTFLNNEQTVSDFKPLYVEKYFGEKSNFKPITIQADDKVYTISGIVDRIDTTENEFRIIDYKTGNTTNASGAQMLYYGTKIQLFVYAYAIKNNMDKKFFGAFYLPIKNSFSSDGKEQYAFSGFFENDSSIAIKCDKNLIEEGKSKILNVSFLKVKDDGVLNLKKKANILQADELQAYLDYSLQIVKQSILDIQNGYIDCSPMSGKCKICEFASICKSAFDEKIERQENYDVSSQNIKNLIGGEDNE